MVPSLVTFGPIKATRPPTLLVLAGAVISPPASTVTAPSTLLLRNEVGGVNAGDGPLLPAGCAMEEKRNCSSGLSSRPLVMRKVSTGSDEATRVCTFTCEDPPKMTPFWLIT